MCHRISSTSHHTYENLQSDRKLKVRAHATIPELPETADRIFPDSVVSVLAVQQLQSLGGGQGLPDLQESVHLKRKYIYMCYMIHKCYMCGGMMGKVSMHSMHKLKIVIQEVV